VGALESSTAIAAVVGSERGAKKRAWGRKGLVVVADACAGNRAQWLARLHQKLHNDDHGHGLCFVLVFCCERCSTAFGVFCAADSWSHT